MIQIATLIVFLPVAISSIMLAYLPNNDKKPQNEISEQKDDIPIHTPQIEENSEKLDATPQNVAKKEEVEPKKEVEKKIETPKAKPLPKVGISGNCESYRSIVAKYFPANQVDNALLVMSKESGCRPDAVNKANRNGSVDYGLFQVNSVHREKVQNNLSKLYEVETNVKIASEIYKARGNWSAWYAVCTPSKQPRYQGIHCK